LETLLKNLGRNGDTVFDGNEVYFDQQGFLNLSQRESNEEDAPSAAAGKGTL
jgi:hypothetical protein